MITWKFKNHNITFTSKPENLDRDISKMGYANHINPLTEIIILNGETTKPISTGDGDATADTQPTLPKSTKSAKIKSETPELQSVPGYVVESDPTLDDMELPTTDSDTDGTSDSLAL